MKWVSGISILAVSVLLTGCYTANLLEYDALKPAEITLSPSVSSLTVLSRADLDRPYKEKFLSSNRMEEFRFDSLMAKQVVLGCSDALLDAPRFELFNPVLKRTQDFSYSDPPGKIPWNIVSNIAGDPPCDAVLSMDDVLISDTILRAFEDGWTVYHYLVYVKTSWRLYRTADFQYKDFKFVDTISYYIDSPAIILGSAANKIDLLKSALYDAGGITARRFSPWWDGFQRYYYALGPLDFLTGATYLRNGQYEEAAEVWRPFTSSSQKHIAAKASFNMALTCEMANNIPAAFEWLKKSEKLGLPLYYTQDYRIKLAKRSVEIEKLDQQMK